MSEKKRIYCLDALRGAAVIAMIVHHAFVLLYYAKGIYVPFFVSSPPDPLFEVLQFFFVSIFLAVSGVCTNFSRDILRRGVIIFGAAMLVTFVTAGLLPSIGFAGLEIYFGILHMFGLSMILYSLIKPFLDRCNEYLVMSIALLLFVAQLIIMSYVEYVESPMNIMMLFGFPSAEFRSADYYPLFPYFFAFVAGAMLGRPIANRLFPSWFYSIRIKPLEFIGRHSLVVYLLHQPIILLMAEVIDLLI